MSQFRSRSWHDSRVTSKDYKRVVLLCRGMRATALVATMICLIR
jgi:hypothetical protein